MLEAGTPTSFILPVLLSEFPFEREGVLGMSKTMLRRLELDTVPEDCLECAGADTGGSAIFDPESLRSKVLKCFVMLAIGTGAVSAVNGRGVPDLLFGVDDTGERC